MIHKLILTLTILLTAITMASRVSIQFGSSPDIPQATAVEGNVVTVDDNKVAALIADDRIKNDKELTAYKKRLEKELKDEASQLQRKAFEEDEKRKAEAFQAEEKRKKMEWRALDPARAMEEDRLRQKANDEERKKLDDAVRRDNERRRTDAEIHALKSSTEAENELKLANVTRQTRKDRTYIAGYAFAGMGVGLIYLASNM